MGRGTAKEIPYRFVSTNFRVIRDIALNILAPDDWMFFVGFEELRNIFGSRINSVKLLLAEYTGEMLLNGRDSGRSEVVAKDPERRDGL